MAARKIYVFYITRRYASHTISGKSVRGGKDVSLDIYQITYRDITIGTIDTDRTATINSMMTIMTNMVVMVTKITIDIEIVDTKIDESFTTKTATMNITTIMRMEAV